MLPQALQDAANEAPAGAASGAPQGRAALCPPTNRRRGQCSAAAAAATREVLQGRLEGLRQLTRGLALCPGLLKRRTVAREQLSQLLPLGNDCLKLGLH